MHRIRQTFTTKIQPLIQKYCLRCHNVDEMTSGIRVDQVDGSLPDRHLFSMEGHSEADW